MGLRPEPGPAWGGPLADGAGRVRALGDSRLDPIMIRVGWSMGKCPEPGMGPGPAQGLVDYTLCWLEDRWGSTPA